MSGNDRRQTVRFDVEIPLSIRRIEWPETPARIAVSSNVSVSGLCVETDPPLELGTPVEISFLMPRQITGNPSHEWRCRGQVVRVQPRDLSHNHPCVGVQFQYYEVLQGDGALFEN
jgi:hypothetical protein